MTSTESRKSDYKWQEGEIKDYDAINGRKLVYKGHHGRKQEKWRIEVNMAEGGEKKNEKK